MCAARWGLLAVVLVSTGLAGAEEPPYKRLLQGEDARKAAALQRRVNELVAVGKFAEAEVPAGELLALRKSVQGEGHWEATNTAQLVRTLEQAAALPAEKQALLVEAGGLTAKAADLRGRGRHAEAEPLYRKALASHAEVLGPKHLDTADSCSHLAANLEAQGRAREAEPLHRKALAVYEEVLGIRHPQTIAGSNNVASNLGAQGRTREAEPLLRKALAISEEVLGTKHPQTVTICNNLGYNLDGQGRYKEAEPLHRKVLAIREEVLGPKHPDTTASYNNLAGNLENQGRAKEGEPLLRKALAIREEVLGPRHPRTATICNNLASNLDAQGRYEEAEELHRKALAIREEVLGPKHPDTTASCNNLAYTLQQQGRAREAEPLLRQVLAAREEVLGPGHPGTAIGYNNLAFVLGEQGRAREAEPLLRRALALFEEMLGPKHPTTATGCNNLALDLDAQGRARDAEPWHRKALAIRQEMLGRKHPDTVQSCNNLAANLEAQRQYKEAEELHRKALAVCEEILGPKHPHTAINGNNLAYNLDAQGRHLEAEPLHRKVLAIREEVLPPGHPDIAATCNNLACNLVAQGRYKEAEFLYRKALAIHEDVQGVNHPLTARCCTNLAATLQTQGRTREAEAFWQAGMKGKEAARLRLAASALDKAVALGIDPHLGLAFCRARLGRPLEAWRAAEAGLGRGLLDDLVPVAGLPPDPERQRRSRDRAARLDALDKLLPPLLVADKLEEADRRRRDDLLQERTGLDREAAEEAADLARRALLPLKEIQERLSSDSALVFWLDSSPLGEHWGCVVRRAGPPAWVRLQGSGVEGAWTEADDRLPALLRDDLARGEPDALRRARLLAAQRLNPLASHLAASADLPAVRHLVVVPVTSMSGVPVEVLTDRFRVSYAPSGSVFARLRARPRSLNAPTLLALGDPSFALPDAGPPPEPPDHGLYLALVLPGGNAARAGLRAGDVLLRYGDGKLNTKDDLKVAEGADRVPIVVWREGKVLEDLRLSPGKLGAVFSDDPPAVALRKRREREQLADARSRSEALSPLPGTRLEVTALAGLFPESKSKLLLGSRASEQELDSLAASGQLKDYRMLHFATHGIIDPVSAAHSALELARDRLPGPDEQARLAALGKKVYTGQLRVDTIRTEWKLAADLVVLSACQTGVGRDAGGEGLLGFTQVLLGRGARSVVLSLWKVDDTATALLMRRFYQNLLGKREGLDKPLPKAEALQEAKAWLRALRRSEVEGLAGQLAEGVVRAKEIPLAKDPKEVEPPALPAGDRPFNHPRYWAAFILIGDPE